MTPDELEALDALHARNKRIHGNARADLVRWTGLLRLSSFLYECERRRRDRAMLEAVDALERAERAEEGAARWMRVATWVARRVDAAAMRVGRRTRVVTRIDFSPSPTNAEYGEGLEPTDLQTIEEEDDLIW